MYRDKGSLGFAKNIFKPVQMKAARLNDFSYGVFYLSSLEYVISQISAISKIIIFSK